MFYLGMCRFPHYICGPQKDRVFTFNSSKANKRNRKYRVLNSYKITIAVTAPIELWENDPREAMSTVLRRYISIKSLDLNYPHLIWPDVASIWYKKTIFGEIG